MERGPSSRRESWGHRAAARGRSIDRTLAEVTIGCRPAELTQGLRIHRAVASHDCTDIGWISRANVAEHALDFRARVSQGGRSCGQRAGHHNPHLITVGRHDAVPRPGETGEIGAGEILLTDRRPTSTIDRRHAHPTVDVHSSIRSDARLGGIDTVRHPTARGTWRNRVTSGRLSRAAPTARIGRPMGRVVAGIVAATVPAPAPPPVVVITVGTPSDVAWPPGPVHPRRAPMTAP